MVKSNRTQLSDLSSVSWSKDSTNTLFENLIWLTTREAAIYLRRFDENGEPSIKSIYHGIYRRKIKAKKFLGKWLIKRVDLDRAIETSEF